MSSDTRKRPGAKRRSATTSASSPDLPDPAPLALRGDFAQQIKVIPSTMMNLRLAVGETIDEHPVLVPFIELRMCEQNPDGEGQSKDFFNGILTMENAAFLMSDLANDFLLACRHFSAIAASPIKPDQTRTFLTETFVEDARAKLMECAALLEKARAQADTP